MTSSAASSSFIQGIVALAANLTKEALENESPDPSGCMDLISAIETELTNIINHNKKNKKKRMSIVALLDKSHVGKTLTKASKTFRRWKRTEEQFHPVSEKCKVLLQTLEKKAEEEDEERNRNHMGVDNNDAAREENEEDTGWFPGSVSIYRCRLVKQKKELYKDPPVLPPLEITVERNRQPLPKRHSTTREIVFETKFQRFRPNVTPKEIIQGGAFGGTYFRSIVSAVTNQSYNGTDVIARTLPNDWIQGINVKQKLTSKTYDATVNKYGVKCGGSLGMWESSGWITSLDPYGWFQWYCHFYQGRRSSDDERQITRWAKIAGPNGRFRSQLCNKCIAAQTHAEDGSISPVIRQTLFHWGFHLTPQLLEKHRKNHLK